MAKKSTQSMAVSQSSRNCHKLYNLIIRTYNSEQYYRYSSSADKLIFVNDDIHRDKQNTAARDFKITTISCTQRGNSPADRTAMLEGLLEM